METSAPVIPDDHPLVGAVGYTDLPMPWWLLSQSYGLTTSQVLISQ